MTADTITLSTGQTFQPADYAHCYTHQSFRPGARARGDLEAMKTRVDNVAAEAERLAAAVPASAQNIRAALIQWAAKHCELSLAMLRAEAAIASPMITGPARFPVARNNKRMESQRRRYEEVKAHHAAGIVRLQRIAYPHGMPGDPIRSNDPDALDKLRERIETARTARDNMKAANAAWRKAGKPGRDDAKGWQEFFEHCKALGWSAGLAAKVAEGCRAHYAAAHRPVPPFESYALSNAGAEIKRLETRLANLQRTKTGPAVERESPDGVTYREDPAAARVQLIFPGKPDADTRATLKHNGFRWAPSVGAWQRHLNQNGRDAAQRVLSALA